MEFAKKEDMENDMASSNEIKGHQTEGCSQLLGKKVIEILGHYGEGPDVLQVLSGKFQPPENTTDETKEFLMA